MTKTCIEEGCDKRSVARDLCKVHYRKLRTQGLPELSAEERYARRSAAMMGHKGRSRLSDRTCEVDGCTRKHQARGFCAMHYGQELRAGLVTDPERNGGASVHAKAARANLTPEQRSETVSKGNRTKKRLRVLRDREGRVLNPGASVRGTVSVYAPSHSGGTNGNS